MKYMNTDQHIEQQLQQDYDKFIGERYSGKLPIPQEFVGFFKTGVLLMPPFAHKINFYKVRSISKKTVDMLTIDDLHEIIKVVLNTPLYKLYAGIEDFDDIVDRYIPVEKFIIEYNYIVSEFTKQLEMKKAALKGLSGGNGRTHIIN